MKEERLTRMKALIALLNAASDAYYNKDSEIMSNYEYDALYDELEALERETNVRMSDSPTNRVGYTVVSALAKVAHATPMLSLDKTKEPDELAAFLGEREGVLSWKLDGLKVVMKYAGGELAQAVTRGNGIIGEDVTHTARVFANLPLTIEYKGELTVQGEAVIAYTDFERINGEIPEEAEKYKNPRNLCSGTIRQLNSEITANRRVQYFVIGITEARPEGQSGLPPMDSRLKQLQWLAAQGFSVIGHERVTAGTLPAAITRFKEQIASRDVASDGLVLTFDDIAYGESLGATSKFPKHSLAFKWADETSETALKYIEWNTSRTGLINPVAVFEPVEIEGTQVSRASLHNVSIMRGLALGEGDIITVYKANMIIPQVADNLTRSGTAEPPPRCPVCGGETELVTQNDAEALYCLNPNCKAQLISGLAHFCGRDAMNIEGLSEQTLSAFAERGLVSDYTDLFTLGKHERTIVDMEGFGKKSFDNLIASIERACDAGLPNFIYALGIKHVGLSNAKLLCAHYGHDVEAIIAAARGEGYAEELLNIKGFGEVITRSLHVYFNDENNLALLRKALAHIRLIKPETAAETLPLAGLTFVITGDTRLFENRKALQAFIERNGGRAVSAVTAKTSFLINNDNASPSSKNKKAAELGVPVITEDELTERFGLVV